MRDAAHCPSCERNFSTSGEFCPFDGERLEPQQFQVLAKDELIGAVIDDRYEVLSVIGEGGMGRVYRVRHRRLGRSFALKALRPELSEDAALTQRFVQEARAAAVVTHPNVVQINDFGTLVTGQPYFVMELLEGRTLARILREEGAIDPRRSVAIARQVAEALGAAHAMGVIHRDLKPDNVILIRPAGSRMTVKVLDFGLAKVAVGTRLTRPGIIFGTPHYLSPEQALGEPYDHRVDVYALGVMLYEMVTGRVPFEADTYMEVISKHLYVSPPQVRKTHDQGGTFPELEEIISRCLAKKPADRWSSMNEVARRLTDLGAHIELASKSESLREQQPLAPVRTSRRLRYYALAVFVYVLSGAASFTHVLSSCATTKAAATVAAALPSAKFRCSAELGAQPVALVEIAMTAFERPLPSQEPVAPAPGVPPNIGKSAPGRPPPPGKHGKTAAKPAAANKKSRLLGSGDIADPWAK